MTWSEFKWNVKCFPGRSHILEDVPSERGQIWFALEDRKVETMTTSTKFTLLHASNGLLWSSSSWFGCLNISRWLEPLWKTYTTMTIPSCIIRRSIGFEGFVESWNVLHSSQKKARKILQNGCAGRLQRTLPRWDRVCAGNSFIAKWCWPKTTIRSSSWIIFKNLASSVKREHGIEGHEKWILAFPCAPWDWNSYLHLL